MGFGRLHTARLLWRRSAYPDAGRLALVQGRQGGAQLQRSCLGGEVHRAQLETGATHRPQP